MSERYVRRDGGLSSGGIVSSHASPQGDSFPIEHDAAEYLAFKNRSTKPTDDEALGVLQRDKTTMAALLVLAEAQGISAAAFRQAIKAKRATL